MHVSFICLIEGENIIVHILSIISNTRKVVTHYVVMKFEIYNKATLIFYVIY